MFMLPVKLVKIASKQLSESLPLSVKNDPLYLSQPVEKKVQKIEEGKHIFVAGKTGMGKTKLIKEIIKQKKARNPGLNIYHLDTKKMGDFTSLDGTIISSEMAPDAFRTIGNSMVWQPITDDKAQYDKFFTNILQSGLPAIVNIDESINMKFGNDIPRGLSILLSQGRKPGIHVIGGTQEVARSPRQLLSQATYVISFNLINRYDANTILSYLHLPQLKTLDLKKYQFYFLDTDTGGAGKKFNSYTDVLKYIH